MVEETLHQNAPDERFSKKVIEELLARPRPLEIEGHPIRQVLDIIRAALPDYEYIEGDEIVQKAAIINPWCLQFAYKVDKERVLRTETTIETFQQMSKHTAPVRLMTAGRIFQHEAEYLAYQKVSHQLDMVCINAGADADAMKTTLLKVLESVLGQVQLKYETATFHWFEPALRVEMEYVGKWMGIAGCGVMTDKTLRQAGHDPDKVNGFAIAIGQLERLAMLKFGIDDIRELWRPPYVPE